LLQISSWPTTLTRREARTLRLLTFGAEQLGVEHLGVFCCLLYVSLRVNKRLEPHFSQPDNCSKASVKQKFSASSAPPSVHCITKHLKDGRYFYPLVYYDETTSSLLTQHPS
jgi:hypothetical protein